MFGIISSVLSTTPEKFFVAPVKLLFRAVVMLIANYTTITDK